MKTIFNVYADPGHAWVKVPVALLISLHIADKITRCSYIRGEHVFLEEDCDLTIFVNAYKEKTGKMPVFKEHHGNKQSRIRNYERYSPLLTPYLGSLT